MRGKTPLSAALAALLFAAPAYATFSIVAIDPASGEMGVAVASRYFAVGAVVPWAEADVGAIATQANVNVGYGPQGLELLRQGLTAQEVLDRLMAADTFPGKAGRQLAIVDAKGNVAVITGPEANEWRGHRKGATYSVQGNLLAGEQVVEAMANAFEQAKGELAERLYAAMKAGDDAGGDRRGKQSASMLVVQKRAGRNTNNDRTVFINVDDHAEPMTELRRLLNIQLSTNYSGRLFAALRDGRMTDALAAAEKIAEYAPASADARMQVGFVAYLAGDPDAAVTAFRQAGQMTPDFRKSFEAMAARRQFARLAEDKSFVERVMKEVAP